MNLFENLRRMMIPFDQFGKYVPQKGDILDVGCGHGVFSKVLAQESPKRKVLGIDPSSYKISLAKNKSKNISNLKFKTAYLKDIDQKFDCILIMDVFYIIPNDEKINMLKHCKKLLKRNGTLIIKEVDNKPSFAFNLLLLEETIMVKILKYTYSDQRKFFFLSFSGYLKLLKVAGFKIIKSEVINGILPYPNIVFIAKKTT